VDGRRGGFTLIELLVVLAVIALLLSLAAPRYFQHVDRSREAVLRENLAAIRDAIDQFHADTGEWPATLDSLVEKHYLRAMPKDPVTDSTDTWTTVSPTEIGDSGAGGEGVKDVHSGAEGMGADGRPYADW
jgi:general secretion pathway protein G